MKILITDLSDPSFHIKKVSEILKKEDFLVASLITKNPINLYPILRDLPKDKLNRITVQVTITGLGGTWIEPKVKTAGTVFRELKILLRCLSEDQISLRYDPIIPKLNSHEHWFERYFCCMRGLGINKVTASVLDVYPHVRERFKRAGKEQMLNFSDKERTEILDKFIAMASLLDIQVRICCEKGYIGNQRSGCDWIVEALERVNGRPFLESDLSPGTQRRNCGCPKVSQILTYTDKCQHGCLYCYRKDN